MRNAVSVSENLMDSPEMQLRQACAELSRGLRARAGMNAEFFLQAFPALGTQAELGVELVYTEFITREALGHNPRPEEWYSRFPQWRERLERLFKVHHLLGDAVGPAAESAAVADAALPPGGPRRVDHYDLLDELGRGGMGVVYRARDTRLDRVVALKMILAGAYAGHDDEARFRTEAAAVARLRHPNIVQVHAVGDAEGRPYLVMEYVEGGSLGARLAGKPQPPGLSAEWVATLADAAHHAHQQDVVHRDLKPANVLLDGDGRLKITDFGLAKQLGRDAGPTRSGSLLGTPSYMAPEQVRGEIGAVGPAADVYALGAILYESLTGRPPFGTDAGFQTLARVLDEDPVPPGRLQAGIARDLETICLKCLHKDPRQRYASAAALAEDLRRYLAGEPVRARPTGPAERCLKWARRRPTTATLIAAGVLALLALVAGGVWYNAQLEEALDRERTLHAKSETQAEQLRQELETARRSTFAAQLSQADIVAERDPGRGLDLLNDADRCPEDLRDFTWGYLHRLCKRDRLALPLQKRPIVQVAFSPDGTLLATAASDEGRNNQPGEVKLWDAASGQHRATLPGVTVPVCGLAFSADGKRLASAGGLPGNHKGEIVIWDLATRAVVATWRGHHYAITSLAFHPRQNQLATGGADCVVKIWDIDTQREVRTHSDHRDWVSALAFAPNGEWLASASSDRSVMLWHLAEPQKRVLLKGHTAGVTAIAFSPDSETVASGSDDRLIHLWSLSGDHRATLRGHNNRVSGLAYAPDGATLLSGSTDFTLRLWDPATGRETTTLKGHTARIIAVAYARDGASFASSGGDGSVKVWDRFSRQPRAVLRGSDSKVMTLALDPTAQTLAAGSIDQTVRFWDVSRQALKTSRRVEHGAVRFVAFAPDGKHFATGSEGGELRLWDTAENHEIYTRAAHESFVTCGGFAPNGRVLVTAGLDKAVKVWDVPRGEVIATLVGHSEPVLAVAFSADGTVLATGSRDHSVKIWNVATWREQATLEGHSAAVSALAFSSDEATLASGGADRTIRLWTRKDWKHRQTLQGHTHWVVSLAFSPDGKTLASGAGDRWVNVPSEVKLWDAVTGHMRATLSGHAGPVLFTPDSRRLFTGHPDGGVRVWDARDE